MTVSKKVCRVTLSRRALLMVLPNKESDGSTRDSNQAIWKKGIPLVLKIFNGKPESKSINLILLRLHFARA
ncbi:MAG: hypothetical protein MUC75_07210 [Ignavibacteriaceae bacterium]|nr:hypothetical protein [Ignavibacteriaceae bacterium]